MPPAPSGAVDSAVKDARDALKRERNDKSLSLKDQQHKLHMSDMYDHNRQGQSTSSPTNSKPRKIKKKKKGQKPSQNLQQMDVDIPSTSAKMMDKTSDGDTGKSGEGLVRASTPCSPKDGMALKDGSENFSTMELSKTRGDTVINGPKGLQEPLPRKSIDAGLSSKRKEALDLDSGKQRSGSHRRERKTDREALKGSDSGSSGSAGFARSVSLAIVEEVLRDLPSCSLSRSGRKQDVVDHCLCPYIDTDMPMLPVDSPKEKNTGSSPSRDFATVPRDYGSIDAPISSSYSRGTDVSFKPKPQTVRMQDANSQFAVEQDSMERLHRIDTSSSMTSHISQVHLPDNSTDCVPTMLEASATSEGAMGTVHREQLIFDMNDFNEEEVYIRRNRSGGSLSGSLGPPGTPGAIEVNPESGEMAPSIADAPSNGIPPDWWYGNANHVAPSPPLGRLNFRIANGVLHEHGQEEQQEHCSDELTSNHQKKSSSGVPCYPRAPLADIPHVGVPAGVDVVGMSDPNSANGMGNLAPMLFPRDNINQTDLHARSINDATAASFQVGTSSHGKNEVASNQFGASQQANGSPEAKGVHTRRSRRSDHNEQGMYAPLPGPSNDLDRLLMQATPMLQLDPSINPKDAVENFNLDDVWNFYYEPSMFGREVYIHGGTRGPSCAYFLPYLSAIQIFMPTDDQAGYGAQSDRVYVCDIDYWPKIMRLHFEQFESNPPWYRLPLHDTMNQLAESFPELKTMRLKDIHPASWFCVAWYPLYRIPDAPLATRFLTYHTFHPPLSNVNTVYQGGVVPLPVYGLEWYNMKDEPQWMDNISLAKSPRSNGASVPNGSPECLPQGEDTDNSWESHAWQVHVRELRSNAKKFARGIGLRKMTRRGIEEANTHHHDFEYFYERN